MRARAFILAALAWVLALSARAADTEKLRAALDYGLWNHRVQTLYDVGEEGRAGLPLLIYSSDDADWQIRLTAVHFMGKLGAPAAEGLGDIVRVEPCPLVRVSALRWLSGMGPAGEAVLKQVMSPEDEREMEVIPDRYGTERMGKPLIIDAPGGSMTAEFFDHGLDLRVCGSSEYANRRKRRRGPASAEPARAEAPPSAGPEEEAPSPDSFEPVITASVRPAGAPERRLERLPDMPPSEPVALIETQPPVPGRPKRVRLPEEDMPPAPKAAPRRAPESDIAAVRAAGAPETLPPAGPGLQPREGWDPEVDYSAASERRLIKAEVPAPRARLPRAESFPAAGPGLHHEPAAPGEAGLVDDAGMGKPENDPVPELIRRLSSAEPRARARAADELGKRGPAALPAVPALRRALKDRDRRVRASAVLALGGVAGSVEGVAGDLRRALRDRNEDVRFSAVIALGRLPASSRAK